MKWLVDRQTPGGDWEETSFTGTGFPRVFYLRYHWYRLYFPLMSLARWADGAVRERAAVAIGGPVASRIHAAQAAGHVRGRVA